MKVSRKKNMEVELVTPTRTAEEKNAVPRKNLAVLCWGNSPVTGLLVVLNVAEYPGLPDRARPVCTGRAWGRSAHPPSGRKGGRRDPLAAVRPTGDPLGVGVGPQAEPPAGCWLMGQKGRGEYMCC